MREYQKKLKKMLAVLLVFSVIMSVIRPQFGKLVFAEEAAESVSENGTIDVGTPGDATAEVVTDEETVTKDAEQTTDVKEQADDSLGVSDVKSDENADVKSDENAGDEADVSKKAGKDEADEKKSEDKEDASLMGEDIKEEDIEEEFVSEAAVLSVRVPESGCDVTINAPEGSLPYPADELTVTVREIMPGTMEYALYLQATVFALEQNSANDISFARFFDINILKDGEKVEPLAPVEVKIEYDDAPGIADEDELSIVHFAEEGTEVITDIDLNEDATEIVYEQGSFSVTATVTVPIQPHWEEVTDNGQTKRVLRDNNHDYVIVATCDDKVYTVQNDGCLKEITASNYVKEGTAIKEVTEDASFMWKYTSYNDKYYIRYVSDGFQYDSNKLATEYAYMSIAPGESAGIISSKPKHNNDENKTVIKENGRVIYDNYPEEYSIVFADNEIKSESGKYLTLNADRTKIQGNATNPDDGVKFYLAKAKNLYDENYLDEQQGGKARNHIVNHIDISISDTLEVDIPLAYGDYYDKNGNIVLTVDREHYPNGYSLHISQKVSVSQEQLRKAKITASKRAVDANGDVVAGEPLNDVFYITGYSANAETAYSTPQVRIEGVFKIADIAPGDNSDSNVKTDRLNNRILYTVEAVEPDAKFYYTNPNNPEEHLYDADGQELYIEADVTIKDSFDYFDSRNECPPLHGTEYSTHEDSEHNKLPFDPYWQDGEMHGWGISGMDFKLSGDATVDIRPYAIEIENKIIDEDGNPIIPLDKITGFKFGVYVDQSGDHNSVVGKNVDGYKGDNFDLSTYNLETIKTIDIDNDPGKNATNIVYEYELPEGMVYIDEDKSTVPEIITDKDGNKWVYKKTFIETEYVWRNNDPNNNKRHFSKDYNESDRAFNSVPEVVGTYGSDFNEFLEFYVRNVYEKIEPPTKQEISPYEGTGALGGVDVGDEIEYEISYKNYKNQAADVVIKDKLDKNVEFVSASDDGTYDKESHTVTWTLRDVASEKEGKVTLKVKVLEGALAKNGGPGNVVNGGDTSTVQVGNDDAFTLDLVENPVPKTSTKKEVLPYEGTGTLGGVNVGDSITYQIDYKNYKNDTADIVIKDKLDVNVEFISATYDGVYDADTNTVTWTLKDVPAGSDGNVNLTVKVLEGALENNGGSGYVVNGGETSTVKVGNDKEYSLDLVKNPVPKLPAKREIAPYEGIGVLGGVKVGDEITYEILYKNYKSDAADIVIKDKLDKNVSYVSSSDSGVYDAATHTVTWTLKNVPADKEGKVTLKVKVLEGALASKGGSGKVVNGGETSTVKVGNDAEKTLDLVENPVPEVPAKKETAPYKGTGTLGGVNVGDSITYEISYKNYKSLVADVIIKDKLDANVEYVSSSDNGVYDAATHTVTWTIKNVPAGKDGSVSLTVKVLEGALASKGGPGKVANGGKTSTVKIGNDYEYTLNVVENPVPGTPTVTPPETTTTTSTNTSVKTGDKAPVAIMATLVIVSLAGIVLFRRKRKI